MKVLQILVLIFGLSIFTIAQDKEKLFVLSGIVYDAEKSLVPATNVTAENKDGRKFQTVSDENGIYKITLPFGEYRLVFQSNGFKITKVINFENLSLSEKTFDANLEVGYCSDCNGDIYGVDNSDERKPKEIIFSNTKNKSTFCGTITDEQGAVIPNAVIEGKPSKGNKFKVKTDSNGNFDAEIFDGLYKILIKAESYKKKIIKNQLLPTEPRMCIQVELNSNVPPHQIT